MGLVPLELFPLPSYSVAFALSKKQSFHANDNAKAFDRTDVRRCTIGGVRPAV